MPSHTGSAPSTVIIDVAVQNDFRLLLKNYQKSIYAQIAYNRFVGEAPNFAETSATYYAINDAAGVNNNVLIEEATTPADEEEGSAGNPNNTLSHAVTNLQEAKAALGDTTHYLDNRTKFRQAGLITGIDPERFEEWLVTTHTWFALPDETQPEDVDVEYNTGADYHAQNTIKRNYSFIDNTIPASALVATVRRDGTPSGGYRRTSNYSFFATPAILQYLNSQAWQNSRATSATTGTPPPASTTTAPATTGAPVGPQRVLILGDSQWDGTKLATNIQSELQSRYNGGQVEVKVVAMHSRGFHANKSWWELGDANGRVRKELRDWEPNVVVMALGGNDADWAVAYAPNPSGNPYTPLSSKRAQYHQDIEDFVSVIESYSSVQEIRILGPSESKPILPYGMRNYDGTPGDETPYDPARQVVRDFGAEYAAARTGVTHYDQVAITAPFPTHDGVHHNSGDYEIWAQKLAAPGGPLDPTLFPGAITVSTPTVPSTLADTYQALALELALDAKQLIYEQYKQVELAANNAPPDDPELMDYALDTLPSGLMTPQPGAERYPVTPWQSSWVALADVVLQIEKVQEPTSTPLLEPLGVTTTTDNFRYASDQIFYANTESGKLRAEVKSHLSRVMVENRLRTYGSLLEKLYVNEGVPFPQPGSPAFEAGVKKEHDAILAFFGVGAPRDPLPDAPAAETIFESAGTSRESLQEALAAVGRNLTPFDMQCYLMENIEELVQARNTIVPFRSNYQHVMKLKSTEQSPAMTTNTLSHGSVDGARSNRIKELLNLCPEVYASLVPFIKIYRVDYHKNGDLVLDSETNLPIERELVIPNFIDSSDIENILLGTRGRVPGAGIKSFSWALEGVQPEEVDNNITAELVMYFQSINDFFRGANSAGAEEPSFLDLLINSPAAKEAADEATASNDEEATFCGTAKHKHRRYEGQNYRIKVVAGWSAPDNLLSLMPSRDPADIDALKLAIQQTKVSLFLQQVRHNLNFNEDGSLELSIDYQASIAGLLTAPKADIFAPDEGTHASEISALDAELERLDDRGSARMTSENQRRKQILERKEELRNQNKLVKYRKLLEGLTTGQAAKIHTLTVNPQEFLLTPWHRLSPEQRAARAKRRLNPSTGTLEFAPGGMEPLTLLTAIAAAESNSEVDAAEEYSQLETERYDNINNDSDTLIVPFFYLGDLIDNVVEQMKKNNGGERLHFDMFLSDVDLINPLIAFQIRDLEEELLCGTLDDATFMQALINSDPHSFSTANQISNITNIGDIPISLDAFQLFFKNKVIKPGRETYYFLYFIKHVCAELVTRALGKTCFGVDFSLRQRFDAQPVSYINYVEGSGGRSWFRANDERAVHQLATQTDVLPSTPVGHVRQGLILLPTDGRPRDLRGLYDEDYKRGIYHHYIGASCGLLKTLQFSREDQPLLREAKIQREGVLGAEQLRELYSANIELVGNNLYRNGMYIYINPTLLDANITQLDYLGLHGYYFVTAVKSQLTPEGFNTSIQALHQAIEFNQPLNSLDHHDVAAELPLPDDE